MTSGRGARWAAPEFNCEARDGSLRFSNWSSFSEEFRRSFLPLNFDAGVVNTLEMMAYHQGRRPVSDYLDEFLNLIEDSGHTNPKAIVVKFRQGLDCRISAAPNRPPDTNPDAWFSFAVQMEQDLAAEAAPYSPASTDEAIRASAHLEEVCKVTSRVSAPEVEVPNASTSPDATHCGPISAEPTERPPDATILHGTPGCYPEGCPNPRGPGLPAPISASMGTPRTHSDETPSANAALTESPVPQTVPLVVTELPVLEVPLSVDSSTPAEEALTCVACNLNAPALVEAVSSITTPAPAERATEQVLDPTGTSDISQGASALPPVVPPPLTTVGKKTIQMFVNIQRLLNKSRTIEITDLKISG